MRIPSRPYLARENAVGEDPFPLVALAVAFWSACSWSVTMSDLGMNERGGNLFNPSTLQGNWYEDRAQKTVGSNDGLRCASMAYKEMMEQQSVYNGPMQEISMPATQFGNVTTQEKSISLFPCTKYRHPKQLPTQRVLATYKVNPNLRMTTTSMLMSHGDQRVYTKDPRRPMLDTTNMKEALRPRPMEVPEEGFGSVLPRFATDQELGVRYFDTCYRSHFTDKSQRRPQSPPRSPESAHPIPHSPTVDEYEKGQPEDVGAGFVYDPATAFNPIPFPSKRTDHRDPWGRRRDDKLKHFGRYHICSTSRMFVDARGLDAPRLGITIPGDSTTWARDQLNPETYLRKTLIAYTQKDNNVRRNGCHIWDDYEGRGLATDEDWNAERSNLRVADSQRVPSARG